MTVLASLRGEGLAMDIVELCTGDEDRIGRCQPVYFDAAEAARTAKDVRP